MRADTVSVRYEPCPDCVDGSCRKCGPASNEHAAPGVCAVLRRVQFVRCDKCAGRLVCSNCGPETHPLAAYGIRAEVVEERTTKRWVPSIHLRSGTGARCRAGNVEEERLTSKKADVTCARCLKFSKEA
jgi:hypothetical protein